MANKKKTNEALEELIAQGAESLAQQVLTLQEQLEETTEKLRATEATKGNPNPVVKLKSGSYQVLGGISHEGVKLSPKELAEDHKLCEELVEKGSGLLVKV